jgi:hypothetical protein
MLYVRIVECVCKGKKSIYYLILNINLLFFSKYSLKNNVNFTLFFRFPFPLTFFLKLPPNSQKILINPSTKYLRGNKYLSLTRYKLNIYNNCVLIRKVLSIFLISTNLLDINNTNLLDINISLNNFTST